jgi:tight adherence protein B
MVAAIAPFAIFLGASATVAFAFFSLWGSVNQEATKKASGLSDQLDRAGMSMKAQDIVLTVAASVTVAWIAVVVVFHVPLLLAIVLLPLMALLGAAAFYGLVQFKMARRLDAFLTQLELALRLIASATRVGLGLRQGLIMVIEELPDPARKEFMRIVGQTNIGVSILDAMDDLAVRMPSKETTMMARVMRVQSQTGGDLAKALDQLANTIKERRQVHRKIAVLTSEGRMSAIVLLLLPIFLGAFIVLTQADMSHALLYTTIGHLVLVLLVVFEITGYFWLQSLLRVKV